VSWTDLPKSYYVPFFLATYEIVFLISLFALWKKRFLISANVLILLLLVNLIWIPNSDTATLKTLTPNYDMKLRIVGEVMPGFEGINSITTDHLGFRVTSDINYKVASNYRIFTIGGSTTEQIHVDDQETWSALLEKLLRKAGMINAEVINTGVSGLRAEHYVATQDYVSTLNPDLMIFLVGVNDWNKHIKQTVRRPNQKQKTKNVTINQTILYRSAKAVYGILAKSSGGSSLMIQNNHGEYYSAQNNSLNRDKKVAISIDDVDEDYVKFMSLIIKKCKSGAYECMFVTQPSAYQKNIDPQLKKRLWMTPPNEDYTLTLDALSSISKMYNNWLLAFTELHDMPSCDLSSNIYPTFENFYDDVHFNELGSLNASSVIFQCVKSNFLSKAN
jgi:hypothetical protein